MRITTLCVFKNIGAGTFSRMNLVTYLRIKTVLYDVQVNMNQFQDLDYLEEKGCSYILAEIMD